jgi:release factor glutamine methyltransferase
MLDKNNWPALPSVDMIISNPPYIPEQDKKSMDPNVLQYEPHTALFVPDNNALLFYEAIAELGKTKLKKDGLLFFEIHENLGKSVTDLLEKEGYSTVIKKDMQGKDRMVMAGRVQKV